MVSAKLHKRPAWVMIFAVLMLVFSPLLSSTALAQVEPPYIRQVRILETGDLGLPNPAGLAFSPGAKAFYLVEARRPPQPVPPVTDIVKVTPFEERAGVARIAAAIQDPINMAFDGHANRLLILQPAANRLIEVPEEPDGNLDPASVFRHDARPFGLQDPQGMAVDPASGHLFVLDGAGPRIVRIEPNPGGGFDGAVIAEIDLAQTGLSDVRGLALDPTGGHFQLLSPSEQKLYEVTETGQVIATRDLSEFGLFKPEGLVIAPSGDYTDDPLQMSLYIADSGPVAQGTRGAGSAEGSQGVSAGSEALARPGNITEFSFTEFPTADSPDFVAGLVRTIDTSTYDPPSPDPSGLAYVPSSDTLVMCDGEVEETISGITHFEGVNVWETTLDGNVVHTANISGVPPTVVPMTDEPTGVAWNPANGHFYFSDDDAQKVYDLNPGSDGQIGTADDSWTSFDTESVGSGDPEGIAYDDWHGRLFVVDGVNREVYQFTLSGTLVGQFDVQQYGVADPEGVEFNSANGTLFVLSSSSVVIETTTDGDLLQTIDVSAANARAEAGLAHAPASDGSGAMRLYVVDRGVDNGADPDIIDGKMYELTSPPIGNASPIAHDDTATTAEDTAVNIDVLENDDFGGDGPSAGPIVVVTPASHGTATVNEGGTPNSPTDDTVDYTPDAEYNGPDSFTYEICDANADCDSAAVEVTVTAVEDVPVAVDDTATTAEDTAVNIDVLENDDFGGDGPSAGPIVVVTPASHGTATVNEGGTPNSPTDDTVDYTPDAEYNGPDSFTYEICDANADCDSATVEVTVTAVNDPPLAAVDSGTVVQGGMLIEPAPGVLGNDTDPENDSLAVTTAPMKSPTNGTVTLNASGAYTYTHDGSGTVIDSFAYEVCDTGFLCDTANVTVTVTAVPSTSYDLALSPGWNLVSWPVAPLTESLADTLASCSACDQAWAYDAWEVTAPWKQWPGNLEQVDETMGLWLHATVAVTLPIAGWSPASLIIELRAGWNLVGYPSQTARPIAEALSSIADQYTRVATFDASDPASPWQVYDVALPSYANDLGLMEPGRGYWLYVTTDCTWIVEP